MNTDLEELDNYLKRGVSRVHEWNRDTIRNYIPTARNRERIRSQIDSAKKDIRAGIRIWAGIVLMQLPDGRWVIVDGNQRHWATEEIFDERPKEDISFKINAMEYPYTKNEKLIVGLWRFYNLGHPQDARAIIKMNEKTIPAINYLRRQNVIKMCNGWGENSIGIPALIRAYLLRNHTIRANTGLGRWKFEERVQNLTEDDAVNMVGFCMDMRAAFGGPCRGNVFYSPNNFNILMKIWALNVPKCGRADVIRAWKTYLAPKGAVIGDSRGVQSSDMRVLVAEQILSIMNHKRSANKFILRCDVNEKDEKIKPAGGSNLSTPPAPKPPRLGGAVVLPGGQLSAPSEPKISDEEIEERAQLRQQFNGNRRF